MRWILESPFATADTETTAPDPQQARLVEICLALINPGEASDIRTALCDPGVEVPKGSTEVHGYTTEHVREHGRPVAEVLDLFVGDLALAVKDGRPLVIQNTPYDVTVLDRECRRHDLPTLHDRIGDLPLHVVDPLVLDKQCVKRRRRVSPTQGARCLKTLAGVYGVAWDDDKAHGAQYDALIAARVVYQIARRSQMGFKQLQALGHHANDCRAFMALGEMSPADLHAQQAVWHREQSEDFAVWLAGQAQQKRDEAQRAELGSEAQDVALQEADELDRRVADMSHEWPIRMFAGLTAAEQCANPLAQAGADGSGNARGAAPVDTRVGAA